MSSADYVSAWQTAAGTWDAIVMQLLVPLVLVAAGLRILSSLVLPRGAR